MTRKVKTTEDVRDWVCSHMHTVVVSMTPPTSDGSRSIVPWADGHTPRLVYVLVAGGAYRPITSYTIETITKGGPCGLLQD